MLRRVPLLSQVEFKADSSVPHVAFLHISTCFSDSFSYNYLSTASTVSVLQKASTLAQAALGQE